MPKPFTLTLGPFAKGLRTSIESRLLAPDEAFGNSNCDYSAGTIRGIYGPGATIATATSGHGFIFWAGKSAWRSTALGDSGLNDAPDSSGTGVSYVTQKTSATAATYPLIVKGAATRRLGVAAPTVAPSSTDTTPDTTRWYKYTFFTADGESNPSPAGRGPDVQLAMTIPTSSESHVTGRRIYRSDNGGTYYFVGELLDNTGTAWPASGFPYSEPQDTTRPLNWGEGGNAASSSLPYDHSPAPNLTVLSDNVHSVTEGAGSNGSGLVFGAVGNVVRWSMLGYAHRWPTVNALPLPETVEAMVTSKAYTMALTDSGAYAFSGFSDSNVSVEKVSPLGVAPGAGKTACETPWGVVWLSREGLVIWPGGEPRVISDALDPATLKAGGYTFAAYFDQAYYLFGASGTLVFDMRAFPAVRITASSVIATAAHITPYDPTGGSQGLYVLVGADIKPWRSIDGLSVPGATRLAWSHTSGRLVASRPNGLLRLNWFRPYGAGQVTLTFYREDGTTHHTQAFADLAAATSYRLPGAWERGFSVKAEGAGELYALDLPAEETNGH